DAAHDGMHLLCNPKPTAASSWSKADCELGRISVRQFRIEPALRCAGSGRASGLAQFRCLCQHAHDWFVSDWGSASPEVANAKPDGQAVVSPESEHVDSWCRTVFVSLHAARDYSSHSCLSGGHPALSTAGDGAGAVVGDGTPGRHGAD